MRFVPYLIVVCCLALIGGSATALSDRASESAPTVSSSELASLPTGTDVDYQLGGAVDPPDNVGIVVRDRAEQPVGGRYNVCYVNGFQTQPDEGKFWRGHKNLILRQKGRPVVDEVWGEKLLDTRTPKKRAKLGKIVGRWIEGCAADGFDAVEFDNLDTFSRSRKLIKRKDNRRFARILVDAAHDHGLSAGQKNWAEWNGTRVGFDFAISEECGAYNECGSYVDNYDDQVLMIEYVKRDFEKTCAAYGDEVAVVLRDIDLTPKGIRRWC